VEIQVDDELVATVRIPDNYFEALKDALAGMPTTISFRKQ